MSVSRPGFLPAQAFISSVLIVSSSGRSCCRAVRSTLISTAVALAPRSLRLSSVTYPNGRVVKYGYGSAGSADDLLSRVYRITDSAASEVYARYSYLGAGTIVAVEHPAVQGGLTLSYDPDGDHSYGGWDRFGRIIDQKWTDGAGTTTLDEFTYTYDRSSNRLTRTNALNDDFSESYTFDGLDRLIDANRDAADYQSWNLDQLGNWAGFTDQGSTQTRTHNAANEITAVNGDGSLADNDAAGNMVVFLQADGTGTLSASFDAWNRLTGLADGQNTVASYEYDGANRRIQKVVGEDVTDFYWNEDWQLVEERLNGDTDPLNQTIYDLRYIDAPVVRFFDADLSGTIGDAPGDNVLYFMGDANFNVTGVVDAATGSVLERYVYAPYGQRTILNGDFSVDGGSDYDLSQGHQGLSHDAESGLVYNRNRFLAPAQGRFLQRDPKGYVDGGNVYQLQASNPTNSSDPEGTDRYVTSDMNLHHYLAVDTWARGPKDGWIKTGQVTYDFKLKLNRCPLLWIIDGFGALTTGGPGLVERSPGIKSGPPDFTIASIPEADVMLKKALDDQVADPPIYEIWVYNCNHWVARWENHGIAETDPTKSIPRPVSPHGDKPLGRPEDPLFGRPWPPPGMA